MNSSKKWNGDFNYQLNINSSNDNPPFTFVTKEENRKKNADQIETIHFMKR
jgi:hypothetical protein